MRIGGMGGGESTAMKQPTNNIWEFKRRQSQVPNVLNEWMKSNSF
jgi:hypothetical protein